MTKLTKYEQDIDAAAQRLADGGMVAFPTETVYGLGADAENPAAVALIYASKQRPTGHPLIVHLAPGADLAYWMGNVSRQVQALVDAFWPGPLTLIVPRAAHIPSAVSGGQPTIGLRCPSHPVAQALLTQFAALKPGGQGGVAAPSANKFGNVSPTCAEHVRNEFPELDDSELLVLDGGPSTVGIESTIIDVSGDDRAGVPVILRPGHISPEQIADVLGVMPGRSHVNSPQVSGTLKAHYAPRTPLSLVRSADLADAIETLMQKPSARVAALVFQAPPGDKGAHGALSGATGGTTDAESVADATNATDGAGRHIVHGKSAIDAAVHYVQCAHDAHAYARELYGTLRDLDQQGYTELVVEQPPQAPEWRAVNDRLGRAAAAFKL